VKRELLAPLVTAAAARKGGHADLASQAIAAARGLMVRVSELKPGLEGIEALVAEYIYQAAMRERDSFPEREARAVAHAMAGARTVVLMKFDEYAAKAGRSG